MRCFAYFRCSDMDSVEQLTRQNTYREMIKKFHILPPLVVVEEIACYIPISRRCKFNCLINDEMNQGDIIVVPDISCLGCNIRDIQNTISYLKTKKLGVICYSLSEGDLLKLRCDIHLYTNELIMLDDTYKRDKLRCKYNTAKHNRKKLGRPEGSTYLIPIQKAKKELTTQAKVAKYLGISISTVKRYWGGDVVE